jgi:3-phenylpropionate/trans-cinnamate dioxygenase ferredoxin subunit
MTEARTADHGAAGGAETGVPHSTEAGPDGGGSTRRVDLLGADEVPPGTMAMGWVDGVEPVLVVNIAGEYRAVQGICSHEYFELDKGFVTGRSVTCALHLSRFDLWSGDPLDPPADEPLVVYPVSIEDGRIVIEYTG